MTEKQTIQFNGQEWEEITRGEFLNVDTHDFIQVKMGEEYHYYRLVPPQEVFPKIFGHYLIYGDGTILTKGGMMIAVKDTDFSNLKLALAESERIRSKQ